MTLKNGENRRHVLQSIFCSLVASGRKMLNVRQNCLKLIWSLRFSSNNAMTRRPSGFITNSGIDRKSTQKIVVVVFCSKKRPMHRAKHMKKKLVEQNRNGLMCREKPCVVKMPDPDLSRLLKRLYSRNVSVKLLCYNSKVLKKAIV